MWKKSLVAVMLSLVPFCAFVQAEAPRWIEHRAPNGRYRIEMPDDPETTAEPFELKDGGTAMATTAASKGGPEFAVARPVQAPDVRRFLVSFQLVAGARLP